MEQRAARKIPIRVVVAGVVVLAILIVIGKGAYSKSSRARECSRFAREVNPVLEEIQSLTRSKHEPKAYIAAAERYTALAARVPALATPGFSADAKEYAELLTASSNALRAGALALEQKNQKAIEVARRELDRLVRKDRALVGKIEAYCRSN